MGDVVNILSAKRRKEGKASKETEQRMRRSSISDALSKYGHLNGSEVLKKKRAWIKKDDEKDDGFVTFD